MEGVPLAGNDGRGENEMMLDRETKEKLTDCVCQIEAYLSRDMAESTHKTLRTRFGKDGSYGIEVSAGDGGRAVNVVTGNEVCARRFPLLRTVDYITQYEELLIALICDWREIKGRLTAQLAEWDRFVEKLNTFEV